MLTRGRLALGAAVAAAAGLLLAAALSVGGGQAVAAEQVCLVHEIPMTAVGRVLDAVPCVTLPL